MLVNYKLLLTRRTKRMSRIRRILWKICDSKVQGN